jgi:hypothetical protein
MVSDFGQQAVECSPVGDLTGEQRHPVRLAMHWCTCIKPESGDPWRANDRCDIVKLLSILTPAHYRLAMNASTCEWNSSLLILGA